MMRRVWPWLRAPLAALGALMALVTLTPLVQWTTGKLVVDWTDSDGDVLIVLCGGYIDGAPALSVAPVIGPDTYWRAVYAADAWRRGHFRTMLVSGIGSEETVKPFLIVMGVPEAAIVTENRSISTHQNALFAKPILAGLSGRFVLLTSDYHMYRAARCFTREKIPIVTRPIPDLLKRCRTLTNRWNGFLEISGEFVKIAYYKARGWI